MSLTYSPHPEAPVGAAASPSMADVWHAYPAATGMLAQAVEQQVANHAPLAPTYVHASPELGPSVRARPYRDTIGWSLVKHAAQLALIGAVLAFVRLGAGAPLLALGYVATALLLVGTVTLADRQRFLDHDPGLEIIEFIAPQRVPAPEIPVLQRGPLVPLVEQMQIAMPEHVRVT